MPLQVFIPLSITIAGLIALFVMRRENAAMATTDHFHIKGIEAKIDRARCEVHIFVEGRDRPFRAPLGHLVVEHKVGTVTLAHEKRPRRRRRISLTSDRRRLLATGRRIASRDWAETEWTAVETGSTWVRLRAVRLPAYYAQHWSDWNDESINVHSDFMDVTLPNARARALKLWLDHHQRELFPDRKAVRATWDQTCAELLRACQQQRDHRENATDAFETWSFSAQPGITYLVIEADGAAFWASGNTPLLEPIEKPRFKLTGDKLAVFSANDHRSFPVPTERKASLQALRRRGVVLMDGDLSMRPRARRMY